MLWRGRYKPEEHGERREQEEDAADYDKSFAPPFHWFTPDAYQFIDQESNDSYIEYERKKTEQNHRSSYLWHPNLGE